MAACTWKIFRHKLQVGEATLAYITIIWFIKAVRQSMHSLKTSSIEQEVLLCFLFQRFFHWKMYPVFERHGFSETGSGIPTTGSSKATNTALRDWRLTAIIKAPVPAEHTKRCHWIGATVYPGRGLQALWIKCSCCCATRFLSFFSTGND